MMLVVVVVVMVIIVICLVIFVISKRSFSIFQKSFSFCLVRIMKIVFNAIWMRISYDFPKEIPRNLG